MRSRCGNARDPVGIGAAIKIVERRFVALGPPDVTPAGIFRPRARKDIGSNDKIVADGQPGDGDRPGIDVLRIDGLVAASVPTRAD